MVEVKKREYFFDNIKGLLIFLVVLGHFIEPYMEKNKILEYIYAMIYTFHMPFFIIISGYFSKKLEFGKVINIIIVYLIYNVLIYPLMILILTQDNLLYNVRILKPQWTYWYLVALVFWRIITPYIIKIKHLVVYSIIASFAIGFIDIIDLKILSIGRIVGFYPFFLIGYNLEKDYINKFIDKTSKLKSMITLPIISIVVWYIFISVDLSKRILYYSYSFSEILTSNIEGAILRTIFFIIAIFMIFSIVPFLNKDKSIISSWGKYSLSIYLTHGFILKGTSKYIKLNKASNTISEFICIFILSLLFIYGFCTIIGNAKVSKLLKYTLNPYDNIKSRSKSRGLIKYDRYSNTKL